MTSKKKKNVHPVSGLTDVQERQRAKDSLRHVWRKTSRVKHLKDVRFPHPDKDSKFTYAVRCTECPKIFGQGEKVYYVSSSGRRRKTGAYHVDHISDSGLPPVADLVEDLGKFAEALLHTPLRVVCMECHRKITSQQMNVRHDK
jgi:hypothetical protein